MSDHRSVTLSHFPLTLRGETTQVTGHAESEVADRYALGVAGENVAVGLYEQYGYRLFNKRVRCRAGELDAVLRAPDGTIVFLEVKSRRSGEYGGAEAVTAKKLATMRRCAAEWLDRSPHGGGLQVRFDVCEVLFNGQSYVASRFEGVDDGAC